MMSQTQTAIHKTTKPTAMFTQLFMLDFLSFFNKLDHKMTEIHL